MIDDYTLIEHRFETDVNIVPVADVHLGAIEHDTRAWEEFIQKTLTAPDTYLILCGDLIQNNIKSSVGNPFEAVWRPSEQKKIMAEHLKPLAEAGKILSIVPGNHEDRTAKEADQSITYDIACKCGIEDLYRENIAFIKVSVGSRAYTNGKQPNTSYFFAAVHGAGGGIYTGAAVNRNERFGNIIEGLDCLIVGHTHKGTVSRPSRLIIDPRNRKVSQRSYLVVSAESWMSYGGYAAKKMLLPSESSRPQVLICRNDKDNKRIDVAW